MNIIQSFNTKNPGYDIICADESGWVKARKHEMVYIFERVGEEFVLRGEAWDGNSPRNYQYFTDSTRQYISGPYIGYVNKYVHNQVNFL